MLRRWALSASNARQLAKLEIPFGHAFDKRGESFSESAVRVRPGLRRQAHRVTAAPSKRTGTTLLTHGGEDFRRSITQFGRLHTSLAGTDVGVQMDASCWRLARRAVT